MTYICHPKKCISCDTMIKKDGITPNDRRIPGVYNEITFHLSNGSKMRVGVCNVCREHPDKIDATAALQAIKDYWQATIRHSRLSLYEKNTGPLTVQKVEA